MGFLPHEFWLIGYRLIVAVTQAIRLSKSPKIETAYM
jgi:hypothetical protein